MKYANAARLRNLKQHRQMQFQAVKSVDPQHLKHSYVLSVLLLLSKKCFFAECIYSGCVTKCQICYSEIFGLESLFYFKSLIAHYLTLTSLLCYTTTKNCQPLNDQILIFNYVNPRSRKAVA